MGKPKNKNKSKKPQSGPREVTPTVYKDSKAANLLSFSKPEHAGVSKNNKTRNRKIAKGKLTIQKKKEKIYTEKELGIPKLNTSLNPVGVKVKGKKGKKFVDENTMQLILSEVQQECNEVHASKLEKSRQLEAIREIKRKEIEEREQKEKEKIESKKKELKRNKGKTDDNATVENSPVKKSTKKRVSFA